MVLIRELVEEFIRLMRSRFDVGFDDFVKAPRQVGEDSEEMNQSGTGNSPKTEPQYYDDYRIVDVPVPIPSWERCHQCLFLRRVWCHTTWRTMIDGR